MHLADPHLASDEGQIRARCWNKSVRGLAYRRGLRVTFGELPAIYLRCARLVLSHAVCMKITRTSRTFNAKHRRDTEFAPCFAAVSAREKDRGSCRETRTMITREGKSRSEERGKRGRDRCEKRYCVFARDFAQTI